MATFKLDIRQQYGKLGRRVYAQGAAAPDYAGASGSIQELMRSLDDDLKAAGAGPNDPVLFRNIEYADRQELKSVVLHAPY